MTTNVAAFKLRFPEYSDETEYPDPRIQMFLDDAVLVHLGADEARWGGKYDIAQAYLAAHLLSVGEATELGDSSAKGGPLASKTAGGVSVSYSAIAKDRSDMDSFYSKTSYGQQFLSIRNVCFAGVLVVNC